MLFYLKTISQNQIYCFAFVVILFVMPVLLVWYLAKWWPQNKRFSKMVKNVNDIKADAKFIRIFFEQKTNF